MKFITLFTFLFSINSFGHTNDSLVKPPLRTSPLAMAQLKYPEKKYYLKATYGQPLKKNRIIFGENGLVPYHKLWRTGANEATEITFTQTVKIADTEIPSGSYTLFSIPDTEKWTVILNTELGQWGTQEYDSTKNILKADFPIERNDNIYEGFTIEFKEITNGAVMTLLWDTVKVPIAVNFVEAIAPTSKKKKKKR